MDQVAPGFDHEVPVPGLVDLATPAFSDVGTDMSGKHRQAFWYRRDFSIEGSIPEVVRLKLHKAMYGTRVYLNGKLVGDHLPCFTPAELELRQFLKEPGQEREESTGREVGTAEVSCPVGTGGGSSDIRIAIQDCRLWSPEDPFLYDLEVSTGADTLRTRFGMRSFHLDPRTGVAVLNGKTCFLRGTNVCIFRFFEDPKRGDLVWREEWVRKLHRVFKSMHWNSIRYCVGFPPEMWYRIADEEGLLIQDEFPIWYGGNWPAELKSPALIQEYTEWMQQRWNHPCVVIWDAQNETFSTETGKAIQAVRHLDLSERPWDNGWSPPQAPGDCYEAHPYVFGSGAFRVSDFATLSGAPGAPGGLKKDGWNTSPLPRHVLRRSIFQFVSS
jgi:beta-galactosidase/beta-glucuronidase